MGQGLGAAWGLEKRTGNMNGYIDNHEKRERRG